MDNKATFRKARCDECHKIVGFNRIWMWWNDYQISGICLDCRKAYMARVHEMSK